MRVKATMPHNSVGVWARRAACVILAAAAASCTSPEATPTPTIGTPEPFTPGDPTATPQGEDITDRDYLAGKAAYWAGEYEAVLPAMEAAIDRNPALAPPHWYRGMAFWRLQDCSSGLTEMELALELDPNYALALADRGLMRECLGDEDAALRDYRQALSLDPSLAKVHERLGNYGFDSADYREALEEQTLAVEIDPSRVTAWVGQAMALMGLNRFDDCVASATEALRVDPYHWPAHKARADCAFLKGDYGPGIGDYERYLAQVPDDADGWYNLGIGYRRNGQLESAVEAYTRAIQIDPTYFQAFINRGSVFIDLGRAEEAVTDYSTAIGMGEVPAAYIGRGVAYAALGRYEEARADFEHSVDLMPFDTVAFCQLVGVYFNLERYGDAIWAAQEAARVNPECAKDQRLLEYQARAYYAMHEYDQAIEYINRALEQGHYALAFYYRGIAHDEAGHWREAIMDLQSYVDVATAMEYGDEEQADAEARLARLRAATPPADATPKTMSQAIPMSPDGLGPVTIGAGQALIFKIVHTPALTIEIAGNVALYFTGVQSEDGGQAQVTFRVWDFDYVDWDDNQGHNGVSEGSSIFGLANSAPMVNDHGELFIEIRNLGRSPVTLERFQLTMMVLTTDGQQLELGTMPPEP